MASEEERQEWRELIESDPFNAYHKAFGNWAVMLTQIPQHMREVVVRYVLLGDRPGDFFYAVLCNELMESFLYADDVNRRALLNYAVFLHEAAPPMSFRSQDRVEAWIAQGGVLGRQLDVVDGGKEAT